MSAFRLRGPIRAHSRHRTELDFVSLPDVLELVLLLVNDPKRFRRAPPEVVSAGGREGAPLSASRLRSPEFRLDTRERADRAATEAVLEASRFSDVTLRYVFRLTSVVFSDNRMRFPPHE
jgi:hypothetical protein